MKQPIVAQRSNQDCAIAALAMSVTLPYEAVYVAAVQTVPLWSRHGMGVYNLIRIAAKLGRRLRRVHWSRVDLEQDVGVLAITWNRPARDKVARGHWVVLRKGTIIDPAEPSVWDADDYLIIENGRVATLLVEE